MCSINSDKDDEKNPVFVLKKCAKSSNPCTILIENHGRAHNAWIEYMKNND